MLKDASDSSSDGGGRFQKTVWENILVVAGNPGLAGYREACERFCETYREPVYWFVRSKGHLREEAQDLTQDFFAWLFAKRVLADVTREGAKFRSLLVTVLKNFLASEREKWLAQKRGGGVVHVRFDEAAETSYLNGLADHETPDAAFDRKYAWKVVEQGLARLRSGYQEPASQKRFECLQAFLPGSQKEVSYEEASRILGLSIEALRMAVSRLRQRWIEALRREVASPGMSPEEIDEELRYLLAALSR